MGGDSYVTLADVINLALEGSATTAANHLLAQSTNVAPSGVLHNYSFNGDANDVLVPTVNVATYDNTTKPYGNVTSSGGIVVIPKSAFEVVLISVVVTILALVTVGGNLMVIISFKMDKQLQTVSNYFLLSLSVADLAIGLFSMPLYTVMLVMGYWPLGPYICDTWLSLDYTMSNASVANLLIISFDRYFSVTRPLTYRVKRTPRRAAIMITFAWVISSLMWTPWIFAWPYIEGHRTIKEGECYIQFLTTNHYITISTAFAAFYLPVIILCVLYLKIYNATQKRQKALTALTAHNQTSANRYVPDSSEDEACVHLSNKRTDSSPDVEEVGGFHKSVHENRAKISLWQRMRMCFKIGNERAREYHEDSSSSDPPGSPIYSGCTASSSQQTIPLRRDASLHQQVTQNGKHHLHNHPGTRKDSGLMIPLITVDSNRSTPTATPCTDVTSTTFSRHSNMSASTTLTSPSGDASVFTPREGTKCKDMYTILIKLPDNKDPDAKPSIRMITESEEEEEESKGDFPPGDKKTQAVPEKPPSGDSGASRRNVPRDSSTSSLGRRFSQTTDSLRMAVQTKVASKLVNKPKVSRVKIKRHLERKEDNKAAKTLSAILLAFIVTWTPYNVFILIEVFCSESCINKTIYAIGYWLCYINSTVNPVCYALCNANFRRTYWRILTCRWGTRLQHNRGLYESTTFSGSR